MRNHSTNLVARSLALLSVFVLSACESRPTPAPTQTANAPSGSSHQHDHPTVGPHHGDLVELGNEEYHAEVVHGAASEIIVYILDSKARAAVPIDAPEVAINVSHDGHAEQFKLPATPESSDPNGKSSKFSLKDKELASDLDSKGTTAKLVVSINGMSYTGKIDHHHTDAAHDHAHKHGE